MPPRLNLSALRRQRLPRVSPVDHTLSDLAVSSEPVCVSRRELLGLAGAAAVALPPGGRQLGSGMRGPFEVVATPARVVFRLGGQERWVIDPRLFSGRPLLRHRENGEVIAIELTGARYPGTEVPADMSCLIRRGLVGWRMKLKLAAGGFEAEVPFETWLAGAEPARAAIRALGAVCGPGGASVHVEAGQGRFSPDWTLRVEGSGVARVQALDADLAGDSLTLALLASGVDSLLEDPPERRSLLQLTRGGHEWRFPVALRVPHGTLQAESCPFDVLELETGEGAGEPVQALLARASAEGPVLWFRPDGDIGGPGADPFRLPLSNPRYGALLGPSGSEGALVADFDEKPVWFQANGCSLQVGRGASPELFEAVQRNGGPGTVRCRPALISFAAPLAGAVVGTAVAPPDARVTFGPPGERVAQRRPGRPPITRPEPEEEPKPERPVLPTVPRPGIRVQPDVRPETIVRPEVGITGVLLKDFVVPVLRTSDLLYLKFQFHNLRLQTAAGQQAKLVRVKADDPTYIIVHFPPQYIAEQAFLEVAPEFNDQYGETPTPPPVQTRMAGPSRLVFEVPKSVTEIPYTLPALLDWSAFTLAVAPTALPPPVPPQVKADKGGGTHVVPRVPDTGAVTPRAPSPQDLSPLRLRIGPGVLARGGRAIAGEVLGSALLGAAPLRPLVPGEPKATETALELPYRLIVSPNATAGWVHSLTRVSRNDRVELWHTRLGVRADDGTIREDQYAYGWDDDQFRVVQVARAPTYHTKYRTLRAIWSPDYAETLPDPADKPFRMSLNARDRCQLVWLMANYTLKEAPKRVAETKKLMLSSLGAWLDTHYEAEPPFGGPGLSLEEWQHIATMGRDQYVKVVQKGYLFPFGHRAALLKVTERKFETVGNSSVAYLKQKYFIVVRQPEKAYPTVGQRNQGRRMPFRRVRLTTLVTPALNDPNSSAVPGSGAPGQDCFWPQVGPDDFQFQIVAEDWDGERHGLTAPLIFVGAAGNLSYTRARMQTICDYYNAPALGARAKRPLAGRKVAYADTDGAKPGDTALETETITFGAEVDDPAQNLTIEGLFDANQPCFYPTVARAAVRIPAVITIAGQSGSVPISIADQYVNGGWGGAANKGSLFARLIDVSPLTFPGDKSGGLVAPNLQMTGLSRQFGPIGGDPAGLAGGLFDPKDFFKGAAGKLLGAVDLWEIISGVFGDLEVPGLTVDAEKDENGVPKLVRATFQWTPQVKDFAPLFRAECNGTKSAFTMKAVVEQPVSTDIQPYYDAFAKLTNFTLDLYVLIVKFNRLEFTARTGTKPDVGVDLAKVEFGGPLTFVNTLQEFLSELVPGFSIDVTPTGIQIGYELPIPDVAVGVMSLQHLSLAVSLKLPFTGAALRLRFAFCSRENPFLLSVSIFGGGGFFAVELIPTGLAMLEASFEFGGTFSLNIGVASGGAYLMVGIYYKWEGGESTLTGYVRCGGHLSVLGLITISAEFYLGLTYESAGNRCWGQAKLTVEIEILFFSFSVTLTVEREFAGSGGGGAARLEGERFASLGTGADLAQMVRAGPPVRPPTIEETLTAKDWQAYCEAFA